MNKMPENIVPDEQVFDTGTRRSLADVLAASEAELTRSALRDTRSAFRFLAGQCDIDLAATLARPDEVRLIFESLSPARLGISNKRLANIRSLVNTAVKRFGTRRIWITSEIPLDDAWTELLDRIADRQHRWGLSRLACYCTVKGISPDKVDREALHGLFTALEAEELSKNPRNLLKHTIALWNMCRRRVAGWPETILSSPLKQEPYMFPLEAFPQGFQVEVAAFEARMSNPDPLDPTAPVRALRPATLQSYRYSFRRAASALLRGGFVDIDAITGFSVLFEGDNFKRAFSRSSVPNTHAT